LDRKVLETVDELKEKEKKKKKKNENERGFKVLESQESEDWTKCWSGVVLIKI
jgi:hypothetical protein